MSALKDEHIRAAIIEQATHWYVRNRAGDLSAAEHEEFLAWLRASLQHTREYLQVAKLTGGLRGAITELGLDAARLQQTNDGAGSGVVAFPQLRSVPVARDVRRRRGYWRAASVGLAATVLLAVGVYWSAAPGLTGLPRTVAVERGEQRTMQLRDGSIMHVNASSRLRVRFSATERLIELESGQALFEVAHDAARPFRVRAGRADVVAVGTQFDVYRRDAQDIVVTVVQGKVDVIERVAAAAGSADTPMPHKLRLQAGEQVKMDRHAATRRVAQVDTRMATAWMRREVMFEGQRLEEVAREFNRYIPVPIEIEDRTLRELPVSGLFNAYDSDAFIDFLKQYDVAVEREGDVIRVRPRAP